MKSDTITVREFYDKIELINKNVSMIQSDVANLKGRWTIMMILLTVAASAFSSLITLVVSKL